MHVSLTFLLAYWCHRVLGKHELPPRFQRKQQMQQKEAQVGSDMGHSDSPLSTYGVGPSSSSPGGGSMTVPVHGVLLQPTPGTYQPMMPPMMMGTSSMMAGNTGGPVTAGKLPTPTGSEDVSLRPVRNFAPLLKPNTPAMLPRSAQSSSAGTRTPVCILAIVVR